LHRLHESAKFFQFGISFPLVFFRQWLYRGRFRLSNEVPTILLVAIVFVATLGNRGILNYFYLVIGLVVFMGLIWYGAYSYKKRRESGKAL